MNGRDEGKLFSVALNITGARSGQDRADIDLSLQF
jgi:hypothetical protein